MKKIKNILALSILFLSIGNFCVFSQGPPMWSLGGNTGTGSSYIGTNNAHDLILKTNGQTRVIIDKTTGGFRVQSLAGTGFALVGTNSVGELYRFSFPNNANYFLNGVGNFIPIPTVSSGWSTTASLILSDPGKNVGIGVSNPSDKLAVLGNVNIDGLLHVDSIQVGDSSLHLTTRLGYLLDPVTNLPVYGNLNEIYTDPASSPPSGALFINCRSLPGSPNTLLNAPSGLVGIGTANPRTKLTVRDGANNNLSVGKDFLNANIGVIIKCHSDISSNIATSPAANLSIAANDIKFYTGTPSLQRMIIQGVDGRVGIGTPSPAAKLTIRDNISAFENNLCIGADWLNGDDGVLINSHNNTAPFVHRPLTFAASKFLFHAGYVQIGDLLPLGGQMTTPNSLAIGGYSLYVQYGILTERVKVAVANTTDWSDYTFADDYKLLSLDSVEIYTEINNHLQGIPSAEEMVTNGNDLGLTDKLLLEKIENLYLYLFQLNKEIKLLKEENKEIEVLKAEIELLKVQNELLKAQNELLIQQKDEKK